MTVLILRKTGKAVGPFSVRARLHGRAFLLNTVRQQVDRDALRPLSVLIVPVIPDLRPGHLNRLRHMTVGDDEALLCASRNRSGVAFRHTHLLNGIGDGFAAALLIQAGPCVSPAVRFVQRHRISRFLSVRVQLNLYAVRALPVLIILVRPVLGDGHAGLARRVPVGDVVPADFCAVSVHSIFRHGVVDRLAALILRKACKLPGPRSVRTRLHSRAFLLNAVRQKVDRDALRPVSVLIVSVIPGLRPGYINRLRLMSVSDDKSLLCASRNRSGVAVRYLRLLNGVDDRSAGALLIQAGPCVCPAVRFVQRHRIPRFLSVRIQV